MVKGQFRIQIMGVNYPNPDGSDRRELIKDCDEGEELILKYMPVPQDKNAVAIFNSQDEQLGWAPAWNAKELAPILKRGEHVSAIIEELKGSKCTVLITKPGTAASVPKPTIPIAHVNYNCGVCGYKIDIKTSKCPSCGNKICTNCGNPIGSGVTKCPKCGADYTWSNPRRGLFFCDSRHYFNSHSYIHSHLLIRKVGKAARRFCKEGEE